MKGYKNITSLLDSINVGNYQKSNEFHVLKFEDHLNELPFKTISRKCDFFQIFFSNQYNADIIIDDSPFSSKDKTLISFLAPLQTLTVDVKSVDTISNGYMLVFDVSFLKNGFSNFELQQKFPYFNLNYSPFYFLSENQSIFKELIEKIYSLFQDFGDENEEIIRSYLNILLFEARKSFFDGSIKNSLKTRAHQIAFSFESLIRKHSHSRHTLDFYANKLNISTVYLSECVKKVRNKTAKKIISEYIILEASTLLLQSSNSIDQIADKLGFSATSNFINFFKKHTNLSPTSFRNQ